MFKTIQRIIKIQNKLPKGTQNPFTIQTNIQQQSSQEPQFLFQLEQSNGNQPVAQKCQENNNNNKFKNLYQIAKKSRNNEVQNDEEEVEEDDQDQVQDEVDNEDEENQNDEDDQQDDDTELYDTEEETENIKIILQQADADKQKSVTQIEAIRKEVNKINKELNQLDQEIEGTLIMSRINFGDQSVLEMSGSQDISYQQYLKEFEQFKLQKQVNPKSMKGS